MAKAGLCEVDTYIYHHQNTAAQFIVTIPIMDLCLAVERSTGSKVAKYW